MILMISDCWITPGEGVVSDHVPKPLKRWMLPNGTPSKQYGYSMRHNQLHPKVGKTLITTGTGY